MYRSLAIAALLLSLVACDQPQEVKRPNLLLVTIDTLRRDRVSAYGADIGATPGLSRLAREGVVFDQAISVSSWTKPTVVSLLTGYHPHQHQVFRGGRERADVLSPEVPTVAEALRGAGYATAAFVDNEHLMARYSGLDRGFDHYAEELGAAPMVVQAFLDWLERRPQRPFAAYLHILDPHWPYTPTDARPGRHRDPSEVLRLTQWGLSGEHWWLLRERVNGGRLSLSPDETGTLTQAYVDEIWQTDATLGRLWVWLAWADLLDDTLVIVTSDHGEGFLERGRLDHGYGPYDELLRVPLLVRFPGGEHAGERVDDIVQPTDIAATLLEAAGLTLPQAIEGRSLRRLVDNPSPDAKRIAFSEERYGDLVVASLRSKTHKYVRRESSSSPQTASSVDVPSDLGVGDRVQIDGIYDGDGVIAAQVRRVDNQDQDLEVQGPITSLDTAAARLSLVGSTVVVDADTAIRDGERHLRFDHFRELDWVRVQGKVEAGVLQASRIESVIDPLAREVEVEGIIDEVGVHDGELVLRVGGRTVRVDRRAAWKGVSSQRRALAQLPPSSEPLVEEELYDLGADPSERHDLAPSAPPMLAEMRRRLAERRQELEDRGKADAAGAPLDDATRDRLRALGYLE